MDSLPAMLIDENKALKARIAKLEAAIDPFARVAAIVAPLATGWPDNKPNSDFMPAAWPCWGDFKRAAEVVGDD